MEKVFRILAVALVVFYMFCINVIKADAEWTLMFTESSLDETFDVDFYVDVKTIRKHDGYVYFWTLYDFGKPIKDSLSLSGYWQGDCNIFKMKELTLIKYKEPMGGGASDEEPLDKNSKWRYPLPSSPMHEILNFTCEYDN